MKDILLNGIWKYRIGYGDFTDIEVPFSRLPVGRSECVRDFDVTEDHTRAFIKFDGITYRGEVWLNGILLGQMLPYSEYEFEVTKLIKRRGNRISVVLEDISCAFGPSEGWENFGGIIRDVHLYLREEKYITDVFFKAEPLSDFTSANMTVAVSADGECERTQYEITLSKDGETIAQYVQDSKTKTTIVNDVHPWSPDDPTLYTLSVKMIENGSILDTYETSVGFRFLSTDRHRFLLNGRPLFLRGVCKHEMIADSGHCPSDADMEKDMRMIKDMGCNFVRLVHYPHNKKILEIADRIGLFVSEEPGLWWSDTSNPEIADGSIEVLKRTIKRDKNHVSVSFWLCFNECRFTEDFLVRSAKACKECDPTRPVSGANCMTDEETLYYYNKCGFDFYTMHPYSDTFERARQSAKILSDKPLIFTEWGGYHVYDNPHLLLDFIDGMRTLYDASSDDGALAGAFFWFFAELNDYSRGAPACIDGVLREGLVTSDRKPTLIFDSFCKGMKSFASEKHPKCEFWLDTCGDFCDTKGFARLYADKCGSYSEALDLARKHTDKIGCMRKRQIQVGSSLSGVSGLDNIPVAVKNGDSVIYKCDRICEKIRLFGLTTLISGFPLGGKYGDDVAEINLYFKSGKKQSILLKNGIHITTAYGINGSSRIDPRAEKSHRCITFGYDKNFEIYVMNSLDIDVEEREPLLYIEFHGKSCEYIPMLYGVFIM